ncbi:hypothetical protein EVAR_77022_1 [Eumeta japonica]|uniref:Uncharacterized protein n=1 Tax=Eumeta variegata TaxID=151549 RepID=A0A4C1SFA2_EUMVA|nr:hypothetical protein EVAR_77022_1 [Eumeta japonica]
MPPKLSNYSHGKSSLSHGVLERREAKLGRQGTTKCKKPDKPDTVYFSRTRNQKSYVRFYPDAWKRVISFELDSSIDTPVFRSKLAWIAFRYRVCVLLPDTRPYSVVCRCQYSVGDDATYQVRIPAPGELTNEFTPLHISGSNLNLCSMPKTLVIDMVTPHWWLRSLVSYDHHRAGVEGLRKILNATLKDVGGVKCIYGSFARGIKLTSQLSKDVCEFAWRRVAEPRNLIAGSLLEFLSTISALAPAPAFPSLSAVLQEIYTIACLIRVGADSERSGFLRKSLTTHARPPAPKVGVAQASRAFTCGY